MVAPRSYGKDPGIPYIVAIGGLYKVNLIISGISQRSGSTLVQRIFNSRPQSLIWGEHGGIVSQFVSIGDIVGYYSAFSKRQRESFLRLEQPDIWTANMTPERRYVTNACIHSLRTFLDHLYAQQIESHDFIGFKEVRYGRRELELLKLCYPELKIILLIRHPRDIWASMPDWGYTSSIEVFVRDWNNRAADYLGMISRNVPDIYLLKYEDLLARTPEMLEWLLPLAKISRKDFDTVMANVLLSTRKSIPNEQGEYITSQCALRLAEYGYSP